MTRNPPTIHPVPLPALRRRLQRARVRFLIAEHDWKDASRRRHDDHQSYTLREYNKRRAQYRQAARDLHRALWADYGTDVRPAPAYRIDGPGQDGPSECGAMFESAESAVQELRRRGCGRNEARRVLNMARAFAWSVAGRGVLVEYV